MSPKKRIDLKLTIPVWWPDRSSLGRARRFLPSPGSAIFTLVIVGLLLWAQTAGAIPISHSALPEAPSTGTIAYQGRLADTAGNPLTAVVNMEFRLYDAPTGGAAPLWEELWTGANAVQVSDGLFNVMLGSLSAIPQSIVAGHASLYLGITAGTDDEMTPRVQLGSVPFAVQALTVPDGSVTTAKIADGAVTEAQIGDERLWRGLANGSVIQQGRTTMNADLTNIVITFDQPFYSTPLVLITQNEASGGYANLIAHHVTGTKFEVAKTAGTLCIVNWIAIGDVSQ